MYAYDGWEYDANYDAWRYDEVNDDYCLPLIIFIWKVLSLNPASLVESAESSDAKILVGTIREVISIISAACISI